MQPRRKSHFFHELSQTTRSGIPLLRALEILRKGDAVAGRVGAALADGESVPMAFHRAGFSAGDCAVLDAGESSGRLGDVFAELAEHYRRLAGARSRIISRSLYPVFVMHFAALLLPLPAAVLAGSPVVYLRGAGTVLLGFYAVLVLLWAGWRLAASAYASNAAAGRLLGLLPGLGAWLRTWTASRFASTFSLFVASGGGLLRGMEVSGRASGSALIAASAAQVVGRVKAGESLADSFRDLPGMPTEVERAIQVGDHSGRLDQETARAAQELTAKAIAQLEALAEWTPRILYVGVALCVGWWIIQTALNLGAEIGSALDPDL